MYIVTFKECVFLVEDFELLRFEASVFHFSNELVGKFDDICVEVDLVVGEEVVDGRVRDEVKVAAEESVVGVVVGLEGVEGF